MHSTNDRQYVIFANRIDTAVFDHLEHKHVPDVKGHSGNAPCFCCKNIRGFKCKLPDESAYFKHMHNVKSLRDCDLHTDDSVFAAADRLRDCDNNELHDLDVLFGINRNLDSPLFCPKLRKVFPPSAMTHDFAHVTVIGCVFNHTMHGCLVRAHEFGYKYKHTETTKHS